jgi:acetyl-CoA acetyltransferase
VHRECAAEKPRATFRAPITVEDVLNSPMIAYAFRLSDVEKIKIAGNHDQDDR